MRTRVALSFSTIISVFAATELACTHVAIEKRTFTTPGSSGLDAVGRVSVTDETMAIDSAQWLRIADGTCPMSATHSGPDRQAIIAASVASGAIRCNLDAECDDGNPCTDDTCFEDFCEYTDNTAPCDNGLFCTLTDTCRTGVCVGSGEPRSPLFCDSVGVPAQRKLFLPRGVVA